MRKTQSIPLITEPHPEGYTGYPFITLIRYNNDNVLVIVDNVHNKQIVGYVLDLCSPNSIDEMAVVKIAEDWFYSERHKSHPLSIEFSRLGLAGVVAPLIRAYPTEFVTRVIGPLPTYKMGGVIKSKRKKRKPIPDNIEYVNKTLNKL